MADINPEILVTAKDQASKVLKGVADQSEKTGMSIKEGLKNNVVAVGAAFAATAGIIGSSIKAWDEQDKAIKQTEAVLKSTKNAVGLTKDQLIALSAQMQKNSVFADEQVLSGQNLLLTFTKIGKDVFPAATETMLNMSQALGQDMKASAIQLGKALNDPINGVTALRRVGVSFNEEQLKTIERLQTSGDLMGAQKIILQELATEFGGSALAATQTFSGQIQQMKNNFGDLQETIGKGFLDALGLLTGGGGLGGVNNALIQVNDFLTQHKDILMGLVVAITVVAVAFGAILIAALLAVAGTVGAVILVFGLLVAGIAFVATMIIYHWDAIKAKTVAVWNSLGEHVQNIVKLISGILLGFANFLIGPWVGLLASAIGGALDRFENLRRAVNHIMDNIKSIVVNTLRDIAGILANFNPIIRIGLQLPDIIGAWNDLRSRARSVGIPGFATGGVVPGAIGSPQLVLAHGGETITPHRGGEGGGTGSGVNLNVYVGMYAGSEIEKRNIAQELFNALDRVAKSQNKTVAEYIG